MGDESGRGHIHARLEPTSDPELVERIECGDESAESAFYHRYAERLYYLALMRVRSQQDAEDVRSETFLRVLSAIRRRELHSPAALARFCMRTLDHVAFELLRKRRRAGADGDAMQEPPPAALDQHFLDEEVKAAIERAMARLKPREREFLRMYYYEELSKEEIARRTGIAGERVRLVKSRALKSFREIYLRLKNAGTNRGPQSPE
jgi:RNA polymerase sigma-70 factor (ECF subfamily)